MRKMLLFAVIAAAIMLLVFFGIPRVQEQMSLTEKSHIKVLLVYQPQYRDKAGYVLDAYQSVLEEEGVPCKTVNIFNLLGVPPAPLAQTTPAVILPDGVLQSAPTELKDWIKEYLSAGGNVAIVYDVGIKHPKGYYLSQSLLADVIGINYITFAEAGTKAYGFGTIEFVTPAQRNSFQFPLGKTLDGVTLSGYGYGALNYPIARTKLLRPLKSDEVYAYAVSQDGERYPALVVTTYGAGKVLYANLPLGHLKANSDDLPLRAVLRTFLFDIVGIPHLMNVEDGKGGLVINWHVDYNGELTNLRQMITQGYLRKGLQSSFDITAGDFNNAPNDNSGFDACGRGRDLTRQLMEYGRIGSHGGWAHNWFAKNLEEGAFGEKENEYYINKNNECLKSITGYAVDEYAAPSGVHPQPSTTKILERLGVVAYYATSDTGSAPNRVFFGGKMVSPKVVSFPIMPFGKSASLYEMDAIDHKSPADVRKWFHDILSYAIENRTVRLFYSHPYNIKNYPAEVKDFLDTAERMQANKQLQVRPMGDFARFFLRFLKTTYSFASTASGLSVTLSNPDGLQGITIAVPKAHYGSPVAKGYAITEDEKNFYVTITNNDTKNAFLCIRR